MPSGMDSVSRRRDDAAEWQLVLAAATAFVCGVLVAITCRTALERCARAVYGGCAACCARLGCSWCCQQASGADAEDAAPKRSASHRKNET